MTEITEFSIQQTHKTNTSSPGKWIFSHAKHRWYFILVAMIGAIGNAVLASVPAILIGEAVNAISGAITPDIATLSRYAWLIVGSQTLRAFLMFCRGFGFELIAQYIEVVTRKELYISLLGKNMTFHRNTLNGI